MDNERGHDKIAMVTGAGGGIGRASALALVEAGWTVVLSGRRKEPLIETQDLAADPIRTLICPADVSDSASVDALFKATAEAYGRLDLLFNNAGQNAHNVLLEDLTYDDWSRVIGTNLTGTFLCLQAAFRVMKSQSPQGGRIINNGSVSAHAPRPDSIPYTAAKHGVTGITKSAALDGRKYNIAVGQIDIGNAVTDMAERMQKGVKQANGEVRPEPMMDVAEVARAVAHMASLPLESNVLSMTVMATKMPFVGRG